MEAILFFLVGGLALFAAFRMLTSDNAVHSALYLIVNFVCVAVAYLMLEAPFLAMVQIAVYAGAIMVLFIFVIMLLGAEKTGSGDNTRKFPWVPAVATTLAISLFVAAAVAFTRGREDIQTVAAEDTAQLRLVHAAPEEIIASSSDTGEAVQINPVQAAIFQRNFDVYLDGELFASDFAFSDNTEYATVAPGEHTVLFSPAALDQPLEAFSATITVEPGDSLTAILNGEALASLRLSSLSASEPAFTGDEEGQVTLFNAYPAIPAVGLVQIESALSPNDRRAVVIADNITQGSATQPLVFPAGDVEGWTVIRAGEAEQVAEGDEFSTLRALTDLEIPEGGGELLVFTGRRTLDGGLEPYALPVIPDVDTVTYGSPQMIGQELFTTYLLPFQLVAVLLLAAMIGVIVLTHREEYTPKPSRTLRRKVSRPLTSVIASQTGSDLSRTPRLPQPEAGEQPEPAGD